MNDDDQGNPVSYAPMDRAERAEGIRHAALHSAIQIQGDRHSSAKDVLADAKAFEAYLKGESA